MGRITTLQPLTKQPGRQRAQRGSCHMEARGALESASGHKRARRRVPGTTCQQAEPESHQDSEHFLFFKFNLIYLFLAALGLRCCVWAFSSCS